MFHICEHLRSGTKSHCEKLYWILKKIFSNKLYNPIYHLRIYGKKCYSKKPVPSRKYFRKLRFMRIKSLAATVIANLSLLLCISKQARGQCHYPRVTEKKIWSLLTMLLGHSFWINFQMPWTVTLIIYSIFFSEERYHSKGMWGLSSAASEITALEIMKVGEHCN